MPHEDSISVAAACRCSFRPHHPHCTQRHRGVGLLIGGLAQRRAGLLVRHQLARADRRRCHLHHALRHGAERVERRQLARADRRPHPRRGGPAQHRAVLLLRHHLARGDSRRCHLEHHALRHGAERVERRQLARADRRPRRPWRGAHRHGAVRVVQCLLSLAGHRPLRPRAVAVCGSTRTATVARRATRRGCHGQLT